MTLDSHIAVVLCYFPFKFEHHLTNTFYNRNRHSLTLQKSHWIQLGWWATEPLYPRVRNKPNGGDISSERKMQFGSVILSGSVICTVPSPNPYVLLFAYRIGLIPTGLRSCGWTTSSTPSKWRDDLYPSCVLLFVEGTSFYGLGVDIFRDIFSVWVLGGYKWQSDKLFLFLS